MRNTGDPVGQAGAAFVETDQPRKGRETREEVGLGRIFPSQIEVGNEAGDKHQIKWSAPHFLVGDADFAAFRITRYRHIHGDALVAIGARLSYDRDPNKPVQRCPNDSFLAWRSSAFRSSATSSRLWRPRRIF